MLRAFSVVFVLMFVCSAHALDRARQRLALALAQVAAHEGAFRNARELELIWQVVQNHGSTPQEQLDWLQAHSSRALGISPARETDRNAWSSELNARGTIPASVVERDAGYWRVKVMPKWSSILKRSQELVGGASYDKPCPIEPITWGGKMDLEIAAENGRYPIGCTDVLNDGFTTAEVLRAHGRSL